MSLTRRTSAVLLLAVATLASAGPSALAAASRASLTDIENDVICVSCHEPLAVAQSPQAQAERNFISQLIAQGQTKPQIERALVAQYGPAVLGKPPAKGFNLTVYILPPALVLGGLILLAVALPRWRANTRSAVPAQAVPVLPSEQARRLDEDLAGFD